MPENTFQLMIRIFTFYKKISQIHPIEEIETKHDAYNLIAQKGVFNLEPQEQETALNKIAQQIIHLCSQKTKQEPITQEEVINIIESVIKKHSLEGKQPTFEEECRITQQKLVKLERIHQSTKKR